MDLSTIILNFFVVSFLLNILMIILSVVTIRLKPTEKIMYLMIVSGVLNLIHSANRAFSQPRYLRHGKLFFAFSQISLDWIGRYWNRILLCLDGAFFHILILMCVSAFCYQFIRSRGETIKARYIALFAVAPIILGLVWTIVRFYVYAETPLQTEMLRDELEKHFPEVNGSNIVYVATGVGSDGVNFEWGCTLALLYFWIVTATCFIIILVSPFMIKRTVTRITSKVKTMYPSTASHRLQKQFIRFLAFQASLPLVFLFLPMIFLTVASSLDLDFSNVEPYIQCVLSLHPVVFPVPVIWYNKPLRSFLNGFRKTWRLIVEFKINNRIRSDSTTRF